MIYNTTYSVPCEEARHLVTWLKEKMIPDVEADGTLSEPRLLRVMNHHDQETECLSLQFSVADTATLHQWMLRQGRMLDAEMKKLFGNRVQGFATLLEEI